MKIKTHPNRQDLGEFVLTKSRPVLPDALREALQEEREGQQAGD